MASEDDDDAEQPMQEPLANDDEKRVLEGKIKKNILTSTCICSEFSEYEEDRNLLKSDNPVERTTQRNEPKNSEQRMEHIHIGRRVQIPAKKVAYADQKQIKPMALPISQEDSVEAASEVKEQVEAVQSQAEVANQQQHLRHQFAHQAQMNLLNPSPFGGYQMQHQQTQQQQRNLNANLIDNSNQQIPAQNTVNSLNPPGLPLLSPPLVGRGGFPLIKPHPLIKIPSPEEIENAVSFYGN